MTQHPSLVESANNTSAEYLCESLSPFQPILSVKVRKAVTRPNQDVKNQLAFYTS